MTFKEPEAAKKACEDATPIINGRLANCNLASLGARRVRSAPNTNATTPPPPPPPPQQGMYKIFFGQWYLQNFVCLDMTDFFFP